LACPKKIKPRTATDWYNIILMFVHNFCVYWHHFLCFCISTIESSTSFHVSFVSQSSSSKCLDDVLTGQCHVPHHLCRCILLVFSIFSISRCLCLYMVNQVCVCAKLWTAYLINMFFDKSAVLVIGGIMHNNVWQW
jgi:hypothetical protein